MVRPLAAGVQIARRPAAIARSTDAACSPAEGDGGHEPGGSDCGLPRREADGLLQG
jgi:hypothetical protein